MYYNYSLTQQFQLFKDMYDYAEACRTINNPWKSDFERFHAGITIGQFWNKYIRFN